MQRILDRCAAIDWRLPSRDAGRIIAAYQRWQAALGLARPIRLITDPLDAQPRTFANVSSGWDGPREGIGASWPALAGHPVVRMMLSPGVSPAPPPESEIAVAWACAFTVSTWGAESERMADIANLNTVLAAVSRIGAASQANLWALTLVNAPLLGLWDPPPRIASIVMDLLAASDDDLLWQHLVSRDQVEGLARMLNIDASGSETPPRHEVIEAVICLCEPMIEALESGAFAHVFKDGELIVLASPPIWTDGRRLHRADGPAISWRETKVYAWKGCVVPEQFIVAPQTLTPDAIRAVADERLQHALIDIYAHTHGHHRCMRDLGGLMEHEDDTGRLWCVNPSRHPPQPQPGDVRIVEVVNGTPEVDGSRKTYWVRVPPWTQTAREAVAWTYGMTADEYRGLCVRT